MNDVHPIATVPPVLTDVLAAGGLTAAQQAALLSALPELVQDTVRALQPQFEQQLLDALLPRVSAWLAEVRDPG
ncbi:MAG: hypothetical protein O9335_16535 [Inhella sp.]|jgi:hypothetical protein|uniref:hypothetical protein n=1 Tax=Inhella sp. TaxID=1921806 RepID=UPI0022BEE57F|nr:hypothetical protein [Inhella sp.]MCZ8236756.1 hypothetical protein [Inhella sp.]